MTNHDHLGKIITYASGLDADIIIWIVSDAREEHASAVEWLNKHTDSSVAFFLVEIHAYKIGESDPAPMFKIVEQPNDFAKTVKSIITNGDLSEAQTNRLEFWTQFNDILEEKGKPFNKHKATPDHWYSVAVGSSQCHINIDLVNKENRIRVGLLIPDNKEIFDNLYENKDKIETATGFPLIWDRLDGKKASSVYTYINGLDFKKQDNYKELMEKIIDTVIVEKKIFVPYI